MLLTVSVDFISIYHRWFAKRQLVAEIWDGKTDYKVEETDKERDARLKKWQEFLEDDDAKDNKDKSEDDKTTQDDKDSTSEAETVSRPGEPVQHTVGKTDSSSEIVSQSESGSKMEETDEKLLTEDERTDDSEITESAQANADGKSEETVVQTAS